MTQLPCNAKKAIIACAEESMNSVLLSQASRGRRIRTVIILLASDPDGPPLFVAFTLWPSITPAPGDTPRPAASRPIGRRFGLSESHWPLARHR